MPASLREIFESRSVAVVGASKDPSKAGHQVVKTLLSVGYLGKVYPVNPNEEESLGLVCYSSITEIEEPIELIVICLPGRAVITVMKEAEQRGVEIGGVTDPTPSELHLNLENAAARADQIRDGVADVVAETVAGEDRQADGDAAVANQSQQNGASDYRFEPVHAKYVNEHSHREAGTTNGNESHHTPPFP